MAWVRRLTDRQYQVYCRLQKERIDSRTDWPRYWKARAVNPNINPGFLPAHLGCWFGCQDEAEEEGKPYHPHTYADCTKFNKVKIDFCKHCGTRGLTWFDCPGYYTEIYLQEFKDYAKLRQYGPGMEMYKKPSRD